MKHLAVVAAALAAVLACSGLFTALGGALLVLAEGGDVQALATELPAFLGSGRPLALALATLSTSLPLLLLGWLLAGPSAERRARLRLQRVALVDVALAAAGMIAASSAVGTLVTLLGLADGGALAQLEAWFTAMSLPTRLAMLPAMALGPGLAEEVFFRGWVLSRGERAASRTTAVLVSAVAFGVVHMDVGHALAALGMGLFLAEVLLRTGSLYATIAAHVANNALATLWPENDLRDGVTGLVFGASIVALGLVLIALAHRHPRRAWLARAA